MSEQEVIDHIGRYAKWLEASTGLDLSPPADTLHPTEDLKLSEFSAGHPNLEPLDIERPSPVDLNTLLESDTDSLTSHRHRRTSRGHWRYLTAAALLLVGVVAAVQLWPAADTSIVTAGRDAPGWVRIEQGDAFTLGSIPTTEESAPTDGRNGVFVNRIVSTSHGYFAIGTEERGVLSAGAVWRSDDGQLWSRVADPQQLWGNVDAVHDGGLQPRPVGLWSIAEANGIIVIIGHYQELDSATITPAAWSSADGIEWAVSLLPADPNGRSVGPVVGTGDGFVTLAGRAQDPAAALPPPVWRSTDGVAWQLADTAGLPDDMVATSLTTIEGDFGSRLVAVGSNGTLADAPAAWYSDDSGSNWQNAQLPAAPPDHPHGVIYDVQTGPDGLYAIGLRRTLNTSSSWDDGSPTVLTGSVQLVMWQSIDGAAWREQVIDSADGRIWWAPSIAAGPDGFLITAVSESIAGYQGASWITTDNTAPTRLPYPPDRSSGATAVISDGYAVIAPTIEQLASQADGRRQPVDSPPEVWALVANSD